MARAACGRCGALAPIHVTGSGALRCWHSCRPEVRERHYFAVNRWREEQGIPLDMFPIPCSDEHFAATHLGRPPIQCGLCHRWYQDDCCPCHRKSVAVQEQRRASAAVVAQREREREERAAAQALRDAERAAAKALRDAERAAAKALRDAERRRPYVYLHQQGREVVYVGRGIGNRAFHPRDWTPDRIRRFFCATPADSLVLESLLIRKYQPRFNTVGVTA